MCLSTQKYFVNRAYKMTLREKASWEHDIRPDWLDP